MAMMGGLAWLLGTRQVEVQQTTGVERAGRVEIADIAAVCATASQESIDFQKRFLIFLTMCRTSRTVYV